tara:strand:+ start:570 stop:1133 length:564 start_codon:yes stop_codon:yes gene_type:complete
MNDREFIASLRAAEAYCRGLARDALAHADDGAGADPREALKAPVAARAASLSADGNGSPDMFPHLVKVLWRATLDQLEQVSKGAESFDRSCRRAEALVSSLRASGLLVKGAPAVVQLPSQNLMLTVQLQPGTYSRSEVVAARIEACERMPQRFETWTAMSSAQGERLYFYVDNWAAMDWPVVQESEW